MIMCNIFVFFVYFIYFFFGGGGGVESAFLELA